MTRPPVAWSGSAERIGGSTVWFGRIGGALVIGGGVASLVAFGIVVGGNAADGGLYALAQLLFPLALVLIGLGAIVLGGSGAKPFGGAVIRVGLLLLGGGLLGYTATNAIPAPEGMNSLQSWPHIVGLLGGALAIVAGMILASLGLLRAPGPLRQVGALLAAALLALLAAQILASMAADGPVLVITRGVRLIGLAALILGVAGLGLLAIGGDRPQRGAPPAVPG